MSAPLRILLACACVALGWIGSSLLDPHPWIATASTQAPPNPDGPTADRGPADAAPRSTRPQTASGRPPDEGARAPADRPPAAQDTAAPAAPAPSGALRVEDVASSGSAWHSAAYESLGKLSLEQLRAFVAVALKTEQHPADRVGRELARHEDPRHLSEVALEALRGDADLKPERAADLVREEDLVLLIDILLERTRREAFDIARWIRIVQRAMGTRAEEHLLVLAASDTTPPQQRLGIFTLLVQANYGRPTSRRERRTWGDLEATLFQLPEEDARAWVRALKRFARDEPVQSWIKRLR